MINEADAKLRDVVEQQSAELDAIALRAGNVAGQVAGALPDIKSAVGHVDQAGESVLGTAGEMVGRAQGLVATLDRYFTDLDHGAIRVGILHSLSGTMTASERPLQELLVMLIEQCNAEGGLLKRPLEAVIMDPRSDPRAYAMQARKLLVENKVAAIFGCWTSASRKEVLPVVEERDGLLFYPSQYEGEEELPNIFYTGATPQQQAIPAVDYLRRLGKKALLPARHRHRLSAHHQRDPQILSRRARHRRRRGRRILHPVQSQELGGHRRLDPPLRRGR